MPEAVPPNLAAALRWAEALGLPRLSAQWLLLHALQRPPEQRAWLLAHDDAPLTDEAWARFRAACRRHAAGEPLAYITGERGFYGVTLQVDARVLDPRPDTEILVDWALEVMRDMAAPTVLDLGTGSGAIALALARARPDAQVWALDVSTDALAVAAANGQRLGLPVRWLHGHWWDDWRPWGHTQPAPTRFDLILSNPPYVRDDDPHLVALRHEPRLALVAGPDGLRDLRTLVDGSPAHLRHRGWLLLEHGWDQSEAVTERLRARGFADVARRRDLGGQWRCAGGRWLADPKAASPPGPHPCTPHTPTKSGR
ncbi:peptide chain release factor N(5)-glutamine methyltransferase [Tepidimonas charontis]|uniref:Release factor glutamine methyltransferase n=1 Tax=Tepidimonas charontis TaxID=2267262 RepID=A0A554XG75_9BURK|nr:peptide chain release factor N(5)-glutamine methyltransferase [Tepidimonas charontis]TSE34824.1 Release factor glutamine methyltransferase [Tepidimonas charontis]